MSVMEMEESSDTSREDRKSRRSRPSVANQPKGRQITRNFAHPPPVSTLQYTGCYSHFCDFFFLYETTVINRDNDSS